MTKPSEHQASHETTKRILRVGRGVSRGKAYHSTYGCFALQAARVNPLATGPTPGYKELNQEQAEARGLRPCAWCHPAVIEVQALSWDLESRRRLTQVML